MEIYTNSELFKMLDYLSFRLRVSLFKDDFVKNVMEWYSDNTTEDGTFAKCEAECLWTSLNSRGIVETFQEYIADANICNALVYALNND